MAYNMFDHVDVVVSPVKHVLGGQALRLRDVADLVILRGAGIQRPAEEQLRHHAAEGPHVDGLAERQTKNDFWCSGKKNNTFCRFYHSRNRAIKEIPSEGLPE